MAASTCSHVFAFVAILKAMKRCAFSLFALPLLFSAFSCADTLPTAPNTVEKTPTPAAPTTAPIDLPRHVADISDKRCDEISGLASSRRYPGYLWTHNDSGDTARLFLVEEKTGRVAAVVNIVNATALDWEDIAIAGSSDNAQIYIGDIGDNLELRPFVTIYRLIEPIIDILAWKTVEIKASAQSLILRYPDAPHNAETLLANARGELLIATKVSGKTQFFAPPQAFKNGATQTLKMLGTRQFGSTAPGHRSAHALLTTGGDLSPDGKSAVIITYSQAFVWHLGNDWSALWTQTPATHKLPVMKQCESVAWAPKPAREPPSSSLDDAGSRRTTGASPASDSDNATNAARWRSWLSAVEPDGRDGRRSVGRRAWGKSRRRRREAFAVSGVSFDLLRHEH